MKTPWLFIHPKKVKKRIARWSLFLCWYEKMGSKRRFFWGSKRDSQKYCRECGVSIMLFGIRWWPKTQGFTWLSRGKKRTKITPNKKVGPPESMMNLEHADVYQPKVNSDWSQWLDQWFRGSLNPVFEPFAGMCFFGPQNDARPLKDFRVLRAPDFD